MKRNIVFAIFLAVVAGLFAAPVFADQVDVTVGSVQYRYTGVVTAVTFNDNWPLADMDCRDHPESPEIFPAYLVEKKYPLSVATAVKSKPTPKSFSGYMLHFQLAGNDGAEADYYDDCTAGEGVYMGEEFHLQFSCPNLATH